MAPALLAAASAAPFLLHGAAAGSNSSIQGGATIRPGARPPRADPGDLYAAGWCLLKSAGGVLLPKSAIKFERYLMGEILSVGADVTEVEAGKKVQCLLIAVMTAHAVDGCLQVDLGTDVKRCFCRESDLLAIVG